MGPIAAHPVRKQKTEHTKSRVLSIREDRVKPADKTPSSSPSQGGDVMARCPRHGVRPLSQAQFPDSCFTPPGAKSNHATLAQCRKSPRASRDPLWERGCFISPLWQRGARGDFSLSVMKCANVPWTDLVLCHDHCVCFRSVVPAKAGIQGTYALAWGYAAWIPAFAGMTLSLSLRQMRVNRQNDRDAVLNRTTEHSYTPSHAKPCLRPTINHRAHGTKPGNPGSEGTSVPFVA